MRKANGSTFTRKTSYEFELLKKYKSLKGNDLVHFAGVLEPCKHVKRLQWTIAHRTVIYIYKNFSTTFPNKTLYRMWLKK